MPDITGRVVVITGASAGIGEALARILAAKSARLVLAARGEDALRAVAASVAPLGGEPLVVRADVGVREDVERVLSEAVARFGHVDVWVNNAGRGISRPVLQLTDDDVDEMVRVNLKSALYGMQAAARHFAARGPDTTGHIVNVSSMLGRVPFAAIRSMYSASKHALNSLTANLRMELRQSLPNVSVSTVSPGPVATAFGTNALGGGLDNRNIPGAQSAEEVAQVIADTLETPRADVYTRPQYREVVARYYAAEDMGAVERQPPFVQGPPKKRD